jgi:hypothetical protein
VNGKNTVGSSMITNELKNGEIMANKCTALGNNIHPIHSHREAPILVGGELVAIFKPIWIILSSASDAHFYWGKLM